MGYKCGKCRKRKKRKEIKGAKYNSKNQNDNVCSEERNREKYLEPVSENQERCQYFGYREGECYITTIVVDLLGLDDTTLDVLRILRDNLEISPKGIELLTKYDLIGPIIAERLRNINSIELAEKLYTLYIGPCKVLIEEGKENEAIKLYTEMYINLIEKLSIDDFVPSEVYDANYTKGHGKFMK